MRGLWWWGVGPWYWGSSWWPLGPLFMLVFWAIVVGLVIAIFGRWGWSSQARQSDAALEALRLRYARGEIGAEEFEAIRQRLLTK